jgi:hypothetical protein
MKTHNSFKFLCFFSLFLFGVSRRRFGKLWEDRKVWETKSAIFEHKLTSGCQKLSNESVLEKKIGTTPSQGF